MKEMKDPMRAAIFDVFERMFYVFLEPINDGCSDYAMESSIQFRGASKGNVRILVSEELAKIMVQNLLGLEKEEITEQNVEDCVKEAANMVCGNFLGKYDQTKVFDLSMPMFLRPPGLLDQERNLCTLSFDSESGRLCVILALLD